MTAPDAKPQAQDELEYETFLAAPRPDPWRLGHLMGLVLIVGFLVWLFMIAGAFLVVTLILTTFAAMFVGGTLWARRRAASQDSLLSIMAIAAEKGMPLAPAIAAFATQYGGRTRRRLLNLAVSLNSGASLSESLANAPRLLSRDAVLLARVGEETGALPKALRAGAKARATFFPVMSAIANRCSYILFVVMVMQGIMGFILYFIMPRFEAIFRDFGIMLPYPTILIIEFSHLFVRSGPLAGLFILAEILLILFLPLKIMGWMSLELPWIDRIFRRRHQAMILRALSLVVEEGRPIEQGLESLARNYPTGWVRRRLSQVNGEVRQGDDWCVALWRRGLIRESDGGLLASAQASGNLAWALRELADTSDRRSFVRLQAFIQMLFPLVILALGLLVLFVAVAYFSPLIELIDRLSG